MKYKKKLGDFTLREMAKVCSSHEICNDCPFRNLSHCLDFCDYDDSELDEEYKIEG